MKSLVFDAGPVISFAINNLLSILEPLKKQFKGNFYIPKRVEIELVQKPLNTKRFKLEALRVMQLISNKTLTVFSDNHVNSLANQLSQLANNSFFAHNHAINILQKGELEAIALVKDFNSDALVVDERTTRVLIEQPSALRNILRKKLHTNITMNNDNIKRFNHLTENIKLIRSVELVTVAFELGMLDKYLPDIKDGRKLLLDGVLWGMKLNGCAISKTEILKIKKLVL